MSKRVGLFTGTSTIGGVSLGYARDKLATPEVSLSFSVGIVIVNWNSKDVVIRCLESIRKAGHLESVVVVDNGSDDGSVKKIKDQISNIKIIENGENLGYAGGNNVGIRYLLNKRVKYIFILNPDTEVEKDTIPNLLEVMKEDKDIGIAGPKIYSGLVRHLGGVHTHTIRGVLPLIWSCGGVIDKNRYSGGLVGLGEIDRGQYDNIDTPSRSPFSHLEGASQRDYIPGTAMMVKKEVFERCGLFSKDYFIYYEDVELNHRAQKAGFKSMFVPTAVIIHKESSSMGKNSPSQEYYMARNHLLFVERNAPIVKRVREFIRLPKTIYEHWQKGERWAIRGIGDYFMRRFGRRDYY